MEPKQQSEVYHLRKSIGLHEQKLNFPAWDIKIQVEHPIYVLNLYRKFMMKELGQYRLVVESLEKDDPYLMKDFVEKRMQQLTISQLNEDDEYTLHCENNIGQELLVSSEHLRWKDQGVDKSAVKDRKLCDKVPLFKLGVGKYISMTLRKKRVKPTISDLYRPVMFGFQQGNVVPNCFQHDTVYKILYMLQYGGIKDIKKFNDDGILQLEEIISKQQLQLEVIFDQRFDCYQVTFKDLPLYMLDTIVCYCHQDLQQTFRQVKVNKEPKTSPSIVLFIDETKSEQGLTTRVKQIISKTLDNMVKDFKDVANRVVTACLNK